MSITSPSVDQSSAVQQSATPAAMSSAAVAAHHHHHGGGSSQFATLLADLTNTAETDPTAGADSSVLTAPNSADPTASAGSASTGLGTSDSSSLSSLLSELEVSGSTLS